MPQVPTNIQVRLKENDVTILLGLAEGLTMSEIGQSMTTANSGRQIESRITYLRKIFEVRTTTQLVATAYHYGILRSPSDNG